MGYTNNKQFIIDRDTRWDQKISFYVMFYFFAEIANATIKTVLPISNSLWSVLSLGWGAAIFFFMIRCIGEVIRRQKHTATITLLIFVFLYLIGYYLISSRQEPFQAYWRTVLLNGVYWIPIGLAVSAIKNKQVLYETFLKWSYYMSIMLFLCLFLRRSTELMEGETEYNMFFGFHLVIPALFHVSEYYRSKKKKVLAFFIFEVLLLVVFANRGALFPLVFYFVFKLVVQGGATLRERIKYFIVISLISAIIIVFSNAIISVLNDFAEAIGVRSRTLAMLQSGEMQNLTGRDALSDIAWRMIREEPVLGWGFGGEYYEIARQLGQQTIGMTDYAFTPHNGFLEFLVSFGVFGGSIASLFFVIPFFRLGNIRDYYTAILILIWGCAVVAPSLISADGLLIKPGAAIFLFLYLTRRKSQIV